MSYHKLNENEERVLLKWLNSRKIKAALKKGAKLSLTFSHTGIGVHIMAELDKGIHPDDMAIYPPPSLDITDYETW